MEELRFDENLEELELEIEEIEEQELNYNDVET